MKQNPSRTLSLLALLISDTTYSFAPETSKIIWNSSSLSAKKKSKKSNSVSTTGIKGFGSSGQGSKKSGTASSLSTSIDRSKDTMKFYDFLTEYNAGANLKRVAIGNCPIVLESGETLNIRGVVALKAISKGEEILNIPYELAMNLGREGADPTLPGYTLLQDICRQNERNYMSSLSDTQINYASYIAMLPEFNGSDCLGSTDFFSDEALDSLQFPLVSSETKERGDLTMARYERDVQPMLDIAKAGGDNVFANGINGVELTPAHLKWAVWLVTSRVLTVQGAPESGASFRLMIPFIDMCNHDRNSPHILSGRAMPGGSLRVIAGADIAPGEPINIAYGGGVAGNDRFIQDYGFLDPTNEGFDIIIRQLMGKMRTESGINVRFDDRDAVLEALQQTTLSEDEQLLKQCDDSKRDVRSAIEFRIGVKKALERWEQKQVPRSF